MIKVPFYPNHEDDMHCEMSVYASILDFFLGKKYSWEQLEKLVGFKEGKAAWTVQPLPKMTELGLDISMIEPFDYQRYLKEGEKYLHTLYSQEEIDWYKKNSNILEMQKFIPKFLKTVNHQMRRATLVDVDAMLKQGRLIFMTVNSRALDDSPCFASHAILVFDKDGDDYIAHDPGLQPKPYRKITPDKLWAAMGGAKNTSEVTGFKLKT